MGIILTAFAALVCISAIALGVVALKNSSNDKRNQARDVVDLNHVKKEKLKEQETTIFQKSEEQMSTKTQEYTTENKKELRETTIPRETTQAETVKPVEEVTTVPEETTHEVNPVAAKVSNYKFSQNGKIAWPVKGDILLDYSMDNTIYFPTLDSYKCNPAIVIRSENGAKVQAGVEGVVEEVSTGDEVGNYVVLAVGDGYELTYGQLKDIAVNVGDEIKKDTTIGSVADPTRYYQNEGYNLYFEVTKDGKPVDPLEYLQD